MYRQCNIIILLLAILNLKHTVFAAQIIDFLLQFQADLS